MGRRIQLFRRAGWRLPAGAVSVAYPTRWQNPYRPAKRSRELNGSATEQYRAYLGGRPDLVTAARVELAGSDVACWCGPDVPCHGDVLRAVAAGAEPLSDEVTSLLYGEP